MLIQDQAIKKTYVNAKKYEYCLLWDFDVLLKEHDSSF